MRHVLSYDLNNSWVVAPRTRLFITHMYVPYAPLHTRTMPIGIGIGTKCTVQYTSAMYFAHINDEMDAKTCNIACKIILVFDAFIRHFAKEKKKSKK